jgi:hypothetical protein
MPAYDVDQQTVSVWYWQLPKFAQKGTGVKFHENFLKRRALIKPSKFSLRVNAVVFSRYLGSSVGYGSGCSGVFLPPQFFRRVSGYIQKLNVLFGFFVSHLLW